MSAPIVAKGLEGVVVGNTALSRVEGQIGRLTFRGYDIHDLARHITFEEAAHLFWKGELPTRAQYDDLKMQMAHARMIPNHVMQIARGLPKNSEPMDALRTLVSALGAGNPLKQPDLSAVMMLTAQTPILLAAFDRYRRGLEFIPPRGDLDHAANYLYMLSGTEPTAAQTRALNVYLVLLSDHGLNASTFAARVIASTWSDLYSCITGAVGALKGPLHGGAPSRALEMIEAIGKKENAETWMRAALAKKERLMGFGHRMYKAEDPRAEILRDLARGVCAPQLFELAQSVEQTGLQILHESKPAERIYTNVEFYSAVILHAVGLAKDMFTPTFAASRMAGWTAHILEQVADNRLIRPDAEYVGPAPRAVKAIDQR
ncbi:MAG: citrate/2-methylcitrate synthase [Chloroflexi bacterium]|nr:citrate/2-methylcitrate synthase [Chloroflexota bacterium]